MSLGIRDSRAARKRRFRRRFILVLVFFGGLFALGWSAYQTGHALARLEVDILDDQVGNLTAELDESRRRIATLEVENRKLAGERETWRQRYDAEVPKGREKELFNHVQEQIANEVPTDRLRLMIEAAGRKLTCAGAPATKRFIVRTTLYQGSDDTVDFGDGIVTVTAEGETATNPSGKVEAWFDPARTVTVAFTELGGRRTMASGRLPLHHSMVVGSEEFRFAVKPGERRGFVEVTADRCAIPDK